MMTSSNALQLSDDIQYLPGVGPRRAVHLRKLGIMLIGDLLDYFPSRHDRCEARAVEDLEEGLIATVIGRITSVRSRFGHRGPTVSATLIDNTAECRLTWFNANWMKDRLSAGMNVQATGRVTEYNQSAQLINPKIQHLEEDAEPVDLTEPTTFQGVYPGTAEMSGKIIGRLINTHLDRMLEQVCEWYPPRYIADRQMPARQWSLRVMHRPTVELDVQRARRRLAYDELLLMQLAIGIVRHHRRKRATSLALARTAEIDQRIRRRFPFQLTAAQNRAVETIVSDLAQAHPMNRILQGDVGCGKTVVALYAALVAVANRMQVAIMAPTELLAEQHAATITNYLEGSRVRHHLLMGGLKPAQRRQILHDIQAGQVDLVIGTHALIQEDVHFARLGLVIIDEQHRFGVRQRADIRSKGSSPHYLVMTATPIPRTLAMTAFGDLDITTINELPPGRAPIQTKVIDPAQQDSAWSFLRSRLDQGEQAYVIYPLIDESDKLELRAATTEYERLKDTILANYRVGLVHGRLNAADRDAAMADYISGRISVLVATTVVEVGIDVPNATCMVIEHADRYGLSQLHQLRGRIGRGTKPGTCFLMPGSPIAMENKRLNVLVSTTDGFQIAEEDLRLRGPGEMLGTRQHGLPELRVADLLRDGDLLRLAQRDAADWLKTDPQLRQPACRILRSILEKRYSRTLGFMMAG